MQSKAFEAGVEEQHRRVYRAIWRWHFYAGIFCIPFVMWLSCTGAIYLFRPQIERWLDRPYDHLHVRGARATPEQVALAAVASAPGSSLHFYEVPQNEDAAVRVVVGVGTQEYRVYVDPVTRAILYTVNEDHRPMVLVAHLHGQLLAGRWGSYVVELAASWAIVLLLTGLYLWWPRGADTLAGVIWVRLGRGKRIFWRDLHAVTGVWISAFAIFLLSTGLPWANGWGAYFKKVRTLTHTSVAKQDWSTSRAEELADRVAMNKAGLQSPWSMPEMPGMAGMADMPGMDHASHAMHAMNAPDAYVALNRLVPVAATLGLAAPVEVLPARTTGGTWTIKSDAQNRTLRDVVQADSKTGTIASRKNFSQGMMLDRMVGTGVAAHEGQLFGWPNQLLGIATALGLMLLSISAVVLWWRRRSVGVLGAPIPIGKPKWTFALLAAVVALAVYLPAMAFSLIAVILAEKVVLSRIPASRRWLGLAAG